MNEGLKLKQTWKNYLPRRIAETPSCLSSPLSNRLITLVPSTRASLNDANVANDIQDPSSNFNLTAILSICYLTPFILDLVLWNSQGRKNGERAEFPQDLGPG